MTTEPRLVRVVVLVEPEVHKAWKREALERGVTVSDLIRGSMATLGTFRTKSNRPELRETP